MLITPPVNEGLIGKVQLYRDILLEHFLPAITGGLFT